MSAPIERTHKCPGCRCVDVPRRKLACLPCWRRLPVEFKTAVRESYAKGSAGAAEHMTAVREALEWYRQNAA